MSTIITAAKAVVKWLWESILNWLEEWNGDCLRRRIGRGKIGEELGRQVAAERPGCIPTGTVGTRQSLFLPSPASSPG